eukprot:21168_1
MSHETLPVLSLIDTLIKVFSTPLPEFQDATYSSLQCIRQMCESDNASGKLITCSSQILKMLSDGIAHTQHKIQLESIQCLTSIIPFIKNNLHIETERQLIHQMMLWPLTNETNKELKLHSFKFISKFMKLYYNFCNSYNFIQVVIQISKQSIAF